MTPTIDLACIIHAQGKKYDTERAWRSEGTETNSFTAVFGARPGARISPGRSRQQLGLQAAPPHRPITFALEGSPLDHYHH